MSPCVCITRICCGDRFRVQSARGHQLRFFATSSYVGLFLLAAVFLFSFVSFFRSYNAEPAFTPTPTKTSYARVQPAATPKPVLTATLTDSIVSSTREVAATATAVPTKEPPMVLVEADTLNVRNGPSTDYNILGKVHKGEEFRITGKNPGLGDWWQIDYGGQTGWVYKPLVRDTNAGSVQVALVIPAPPPPPTATRAPVPTSTPRPRVAVRPTNTPVLDLEIDLRSLLRYVESFIGVDVTVVAEVIQVVGPTG